MACTQSPREVRSKVSQAASYSSVVQRDSRSTGWLNSREWPTVGSESTSVQTHNQCVNYEQYVSQGVNIETMDSICAQWIKKQTNESHRQWKTLTKPRRKKNIKICSLLYIYKWMWSFPWCTVSSQWSFKFIHGQHGFI